MHDIVERGWCYDRCMYTLTTRAIRRYNNYKHNTVLSVQAIVQLHKQVNGILEFVPVCHESWDVAKQ